VHAGQTQSNISASRNDEGFPRFLKLLWREPKIFKEYAQKKLFQVYDLGPAYDWNVGL
jgi:hypothetical protein